MIVTKGHLKESRNGTRRNNIDKTALK